MPMIDKKSSPKKKITGPKAFWGKVLKPGLLSANLLLVGMIGGLFLLSYFEITPQIKEMFSAPQYTYQIGESEITAYLVMKSIVTAIVIFWLAAILSAFGERRIGNIRKIRASSRVLFTKIFQIAIYIVAFLVGMDVIGIDLTTLTVFSGAVGIGLGFGLQKIASNFISGLILLMERAIEVGDLIELDGSTTGFVRKNSARHTLIETLEGREIMVPNEDFITNRVINWTYSNTKARIDVPVGVSYNSDLELVQKLIIEAALEHPMCSKDPAPNCFLRNFNSSSVDFLLLFWVDDVTQGRWAPQSEVMFTIWRKFKENGVEIPFPQQDIHLISAPGLNMGGENITEVGKDNLNDS